MEKVNDDMNDGMNNFGDKAPKKRINKGFKIWIIILAAAVLICVLVAAFAPAKFSFLGTKSYNGPYIGVLYIEGVITAAAPDMFGAVSGYNHGWILNEIDNLIYDGDNKALVLFIDTPGGGVYETDELYLKIKEYKELTGRPVFAAMGSMAASGGYYTAVAADKIFANRNTITGSIGITMNTIYDISGLLERYGIRTTTITSGKNKAMGDMTQPLTDEQEAILQSISDDAYNQFVGIVAMERFMDIDEVKTLADGRIYTARQAFEHGLVDEIGTLDQAIGKLQEEHDLYDCYTVDLYYIDDSFWAKLLSMKSSFNFSTDVLGSVLEMSGKTDELRLDGPVNYYFSF